MKGEVNILKGKAVTHSKCKIYIHENRMVLLMIDTDTRADQRCFTRLQSCLIPCDIHMQ